MTTGWYWTDGAERFGPVEASALAAMAHDGRLDAATPVWTAGFADWQAAGTQPWYPPLLPPPPPTSVATTATMPPTTGVAPLAAPATADAATLACPACRTAASPHAQVCPACHASFSLPYRVALARIWPRARLVFLVLAPLLLLGAVRGETLPIVVFGTLFPALIVALYAKVVADRPVSLGEYHRTGGSWSRGGGGSSAFFVWWSD